MHQCPVILKIQTMMVMQNSTIHGWMCNSMVFCTHAVDLSFGEDIIEDPLYEGSLLEDSKSEDHESSCVSVALNRVESGNMTCHRAPFAPQSSILHSGQHTQYFYVNLTLGHKCKEEVQRCYTQQCLCGN